MTPESKAKWLAALRSGKYKQGKGMLKCEGRYCCLGVAVEIGISTPNELFPETLCTEEDFLDECLQRKLASLNDGGRSFKKIADYIEEKL